LNQEAEIKLIDYIKIILLCYSWNSSIKGAITWYYTICY